MIAVATACCGSDYEFLVVGDTHYDSTDTWCESAAWHKSQLNSHAWNLKRWERAIPNLLQEAGQRAAEGVDFVAHMGDMIFGECGDADLHEKAARDGLAMMVDTFKMPFYVVKGNHEARNKFARDAFNKVVRPYQEKTWGHVSSDGKANYAMMHKGDLYICFDFLEPDIEFVEKTLLAYPTARHLFFLSHSPLIPCTFNAAPAAIFDKPKEFEKRRKLIDLLASRSAVVLCGHLHRSIFLRYQCEAGVVTQVCIYSMPAEEKPLPVNRIDGDGKMFIEHKEVAKAIAGESPQAKLLKEILGGIETCSDFGAAAGYVVMRRGTDEVWADFYFYGDNKPLASFAMRP